MATYQELKAQAEKLLAQAEELRQKEVSETIADIKAKMAAMGITLKDLTETPKPSSKPVSVVKYRNADGQTWSGGRGRKPEWVMQVLAAGKDIEEYRVS